MSKNVAFEAQMRSNGEWRTLGIFDDRGDAVVEAERLIESRRTTAVRVLQLVFAEAGGAVREYTVYKASCLDEENGRALRAAAHGEAPRTRSRWVDGELFRPRGIARRAVAPERRRWPSAARAALLGGTLIAVTLLSL